MDGSGWTTALAEAGVASAGTADSFLKVTHLTRTRHAHQVTLLTLRNLLKEAFLKNKGSADDHSFMAWRISMAEAYPTFKFWDLIERLETLILIFCSFPCMLKHWNNLYHSSSLWIIQSVW